MILPKIDLHAHAVPEREYPVLHGTYFLTPEELRVKYDEIGVERGVLLPIASSEKQSDLLTNRDARKLTESHPETCGWWFCNVDPRWLEYSPHTDLTPLMEYFKSRGAKGIGEVTTNLYIDDPFMENLFFHAERCGLPLLFHIGTPGGGEYGIGDDLGLPRLERALQKYPKLQFIGHSHKWWSEISGDCTEENRGKNPPGRVTPGGRVVELMRRYPNMTGDLSAGSGGNAIMRDPEFGCAFLEEFQDKLYFGVDYCSAATVMGLSHFLDGLVESGKLSQTAYNKICRENALRLLER